MLQALTEAIQGNMWVGITLAICFLVFGAVTAWMFRQSIVSWLDILDAFVPWAQGEQIRSQAEIIYAQGEGQYQIALGKAEHQYALNGKHAAGVEMETHDGATFSAKAEGFAASSTIATSGTTFMGTVAPEFARLGAVTPPPPPDATLGVPTGMPHAMPGVPGMQPGKPQGMPPGMGGSGSSRMFMMMFFVLGMLVIGVGLAMFYGFLDLSIITNLFGF